MKRKLTFILGALILIQGYSANANSKNKLQKIVKVENKHEQISDTSLTLQAQFDSTDLKTSDDVPSRFLVQPSFLLNALSGYFLYPTHGVEISLSQNIFNFETESKNIGSGYHYVSSSISKDSFSSLSTSYAVNKYFFIGMSLSYINYTSQSTSSYSNANRTTEQKSYSTSNGFGDPALNLGGRIYSDLATFVFALAHKTSSDKAESNNLTSNSSESNTKIGGNTTTPSITIHTNSEKLKFGGTLAYVIRHENVTKNNQLDGSSTLSVENGGNLTDLNLFVETKLKSLSFGGTLGYSKMDSSRGRTTRYDGSIYESDVSLDLAIGTATVYMNIAMSENISLAPSLSYGRFFFNSLSDQTELVKRDLMGMGLVLRSNF